MRSKRPRPSAVPAKYRRYKPSEWPGGHGDWVAAREEWNAAQERVVIAGTRHDGGAYAYEAGPLGDFTDLVRARREARAIDVAQAYTQE